MFYSLKAYPQMPQLCINLKTMVQSLDNGKFKENEEKSYIIHGGQAVLSMFTNQDTKSWTMVITDRRGNSCIIYTGIGFDVMLKNLLGTGL
jgi:hypothetical protein